MTFIRNISKLICINRGLLTSDYRFILKKFFHNNLFLFSKVNPRQYIYEESIQKYFNRLSSNLELIPHDLPIIQREQIKVLINKRDELLNNIRQINELYESSKDDVELKTSIIKERENYENGKSQLEEELFFSLIPDDKGSFTNEVILEVSAGVGGQEAMLFARSLFEMYIGYSSFCGWEFTVTGMYDTELGGMRNGSLLIEGNDAFNKLQFESGVHRVQRVPSTEKSGRVHTSTVTVAVLPQPKEIEVKLEDKDLVIETKRASGAGGQHVNTTDSAVRISHLPSGLVAECQTGRSQIRNKAVALKQLKAKLFQLQYNAQKTEFLSLRRSQVGTSSRSDKVRTYNYNQDRITDHRLNVNFHSIENFLSGSKLLDNMVEKLLQLKQEEQIEIFLKQFS